MGFDAAPFCGSDAAQRGVPTGAAAIGLDGRAKCAHRVPVAGGNDEVTRRQAAELATPPPEVILASGSAAAGPLLQVTHPRLAKSAGTN